MDSIPKAPLINARVLAKNSILNIGGDIIVGVIAVVIVPLIVRAMGFEAYGLLALVLMMFSSFGIIDLGLGKTITKFVAEYLEKQDLDRVRDTFWLSALTQAFIGVLGGVILFLLTPMIVKDFLIVPDHLIEEAYETLYLISFSGVFVLLSSSFRGTLAGAQRFDLVNGIRVVLNASTYLMPLVGSYANLGISQIVFLLLLARVLASIAYLTGCMLILPELRYPRAFQFGLLRLIFSYSGWVAISNCIVPILVQADRYLIGALIGVQDVTFYAVPYEVLNGLWIIPGGIASVVFPAFSSLKARESYKLVPLYKRTVKYLFIALAPVVLLVVVFSEKILLFWQGPEFAQRSSLVLQLLVIGVLINSLGWVPSNMILGAGRPDIVTKIHLVQLLPYLGILYFLTTQHGIVGASLAFLVRMSAESILMFFASWKLLPQMISGFATEFVKPILFCAIYVVILYFIRITELPIMISIVFALTVAVIYLIAIWNLVLDELDHELVASFVPFRKLI